MATLAAFDAAAGVSGSKNGLAPPFGVGGSGTRNGVVPDEASACAELDAASVSNPVMVALVSASALRFRSAVGATVGSAF